MSVFELPANIKQIGSIGEGLRIYVEDYVCSYLQQYAEAGGYEERLALLVGRQMVIDGQAVLFISGAVQGKDIKKENGISVFTPKSFEYAEDMAAKYFPGMEVVGWMQSQPSYGVFLNTVYAGYHMKTFNDLHQVLFVIDPIEKVNCFYTYGKDVKDITEARGYFVYYDKNKGMHDYMLEHKAGDVHIKLKPQPVALPTERTLYSPREEEEEQLEDALESFRYGGDRYGGDRSPESFIKNRQSVRNLKKSASEQKRVLNLLVSLSGVLFVICFVMGAGLIQNQDRISQLEGQIVQLSTAYKNVMVEMKDTTASVFAAQADEESIPLEASNMDEIPAGEQAALIVEDGNKNLEEKTLAQAQPVEEVVEEIVEQPVAQNPPPVTVAEIPDTYVVQEGDNLSYISLKFYGTKGMVYKIMEYNGMDDDKIFFGKVLMLPPIGE